MKIHHLLVTLVAVIGVVVQQTFCRSVDTYASRSAGSVVYDFREFVDANRILMFIANTGSFARDIELIFAPEAGLYFPYTSVADIESGTNVSSLVYSAGIWIGGLVHDEIRVSVAEYSQEFYPGPMSNHTFQPDAETNPAYRVYKLFADSLADNPNFDYLSWPTDQGAPQDDFGQPLIMGRQTLWTVFNDANVAVHTTNAGGTAPLGVEIRQLVWATDRPPEHSSVYMQYWIYNQGVDTITDCYLSVWIDPDLGGFIDDITGCDSLHDLFYCYNSDNNDAVYGLRPPALGCKILYGPVVPSSRDSAKFGFGYLQGFRNLPMCSFQVYGNGGDIRDPDTVTQTYNLMKGLMPDGNVPANGTLFRYPGDPVTGTGELDLWPGDRRMMGSCGPFTMNPGDSQAVTVKISAAQDKDRLRSLATVRNYLDDTTGLSGGIDSNPAPPLVPEKYGLFQNYPNPFNPSTTILYNLPASSHVMLEVINSLGQRVKLLVNEIKPAGEYAVSWNGTDKNGDKVASGIYFYRLKAGEYSATRKMVLVR